MMNCGECGKGLEGCDYEDTEVKSVYVLVSEGLGIGLVFGEWVRCIECLVPRTTRQKINLLRAKQKNADDTINRVEAEVAIVRKHCTHEAMPEERRCKHCDVYL